MQTVAYFIDSAVFGGLENVLLYTWANLDRNRWRPVLLHHPEPGLVLFLKMTKSLGIEVRAVPRITPRSFFAGLPRFIGELQALHPSIFHAQINWPPSCQGGLLAAALSRVPGIVATVHLFPEVAISRATYALQRVLTSAVDCYIGVSADVLKRLSQGYGIPDRKLRIVHNGVSLNRFDVPADPTLRATLTAGTERPVILMIGRLVRQKGHRFVLDAAALLPDAVFVFAGEGEELEALEAQARKLGLTSRVVFLGQRQDIPDLLACADLVILPSLFEGLPVSILEAMAAGKPVIASDIAGTNETIVHEQTGLLVPPADSAALAAAIRRLLSSREFAKQLAAGGKARAREYFSAVSMVRGVTQVYEHVLTSS